MKLLIPSLLIALGAIAGCGHKPVAQHTPQNPCSWLKGDLAEMYASLSQNFSGYADSPEVRKTADSAYQEAVAEAQTCKDEIDYLKSIRKFIASFKDPHVSVKTAKLEGIRKELFEVTTGFKAPSEGLSIQYTATGLYLQKYGSHFIVKDRDPALAPTEVQIGDELQSCEGLAAIDLLNKEILPYTPVSAAEAAEYNATPTIFNRWDKKAGAKYACRFLKKGKPVEANLTWHPVNENYLKEKFAPEPKTLYAIEKTRYGHWVTLKSFAGYSNEANAQLKNFADDAKNLSKDHVIVVDLRGNSGGNSSWGKAWIQNLIGHEFDLKGGREFVFASPGNTRHFENLHAHLMKTNGISGEEKHWEILLSALHNNPGKIALLPDESGPDKTKKDAGIFKGKIYLLTDSGVFSSGELFTEMLLALPCTTQVGTSTNASTFYSDIRFDMTSHGLVFSYPTMGESGGDHKRASGEPFVPSIRLEKNPAQELKGRDSQRLALETLIKRRGL